MPLPTKEEMRAEFHNLCAARDRIMASAAPHRAAYDKKRAEIIAKEERELQPLTATMKAAEEQLHDICQQIAMLSRALGGQVGEPASAGNNPPPLPASN